MTESFSIGLDEVETFGRALARPECVACTASGVTWVSHAPAEGAGGVARIDAGGDVRYVLASAGAPPDFMPNGWSLEPGGAFLVANLADSGGVWRLTRDGDCRPLLMEVEGVAMPPVNFVHRDEAGRVWVSISTWRLPRDRAFHRDVADGTVILLDRAGARVVADGLGYTNEVKVDPSGRFLYAHETIARRLVRFPITGAGLGRPETVVEYLDGVFPDGFEFDEAGGIWCASVLSNRVVRIDPDGSQHVVLEDCDPDAVADGMRHWREGTFTREDMNIGAGRTLRNIASITFGGADRRTAYLGSLFGESLFRFRSPVAGARPAHWEW